MLKKLTDNKFFENKVFVFSVIVLVPILILAIIGPYIAPYDPLEINPSMVLKSAAPGHPLGTDEFGRDILSRLICGIRPTFIVAIGATALSLVAGVLLGIFAGYFGGAVEQIIMRVMDIILCFPPILLALVVVGFWGPGIQNLIVTIGIVYSPYFARLAFSSTMQVKKQEFIEAEISLGANFVRILSKGIFPNILAPIIIQISLTLASAILLESGLSFLGLGIVPPTPSLGLMIGEARNYILLNPMYVIWPSLFLGVTILVINIMGDSLRDILDPRLHA